MSQLELNGGIFQSTRNSSLCENDGCGVTMYHFQVNPDLDGHVLDNYRRVNSASKMLLNL